MEERPIPSDITVTDENDAPISEGKEEFSFDSLKPKIKPIWKIIFTVILLACIGTSLYFSFNALSLDTYEFSEVDGGWELTGFHNDGTTKEITVDYVMVKKGVHWIKDENRPIVSIREYALCCDNTVEKIHIGNTVNKIDNLAFYSCKNLQAVLVSDDNRSYTSENGILYTKDKTEIILFPISYIDYEYNTLIEYGEEKTMRYTIAPTVTEIGALCFAYAKNLIDVALPVSLKRMETLSFFRCESLEKLSLPDGLQYIGSDSFSYCKKLTYMYIPASVTEIGHHAFYECTGLKEINIAQSENDFKNVKLGDYWKNSSLLDPIVLKFNQERRV